jgi:hypothetical protein
VFPARTAAGHHRDGLLAVSGCKAGGDPGITPGARAHAEYLTPENALDIDQGEIFPGASICHSQHGPYSRLKFTASHLNINTVKKSLEEHAP